jgi:hypothetical protein
MKNGKLAKTIILAVLLIVAGYFLGSVCNRISQQYNLFFSLSMPALYLTLWLLGALCAVAVTAGLASVLLRPLWVCFIAFALSAVAILLAWEVNLISLVLVLLYFLVGLFYARGVAKGLEERISFSVRPISDNQTFLLIVLAILVCASFYSGYAAEIEREGFQLPPFITDRIVGMVEEQFEGWAEMGPADRQAAEAEFREQLDTQVQSMVEPFKPYIPMAVAAILFGILITIITLFSWIPILILRVIFSGLTALRVTRMVTEMREVERLTLV